MIKVIIHTISIINRRKFRSQTSNNMDRWKAEQGRGREKRKIRRKKSRRERVRRKKMKMREKVGKSRFTVCFQCGSGGSKSRLAKAAGAEPSGQMRNEKLHAVVARSTFRSQNVKSTRGSDHFLEVQMCFRVAGARDCAPCQKWAKRGGFVAFPKTMAGVGHLNRICKDAFSVAGAVQETSSSELLGSPGGDFLRGVAFWNIRSSGLLRWFCVTSAALRMTWHHFFVAGAVV